LAKKDYDEKRQYQREIEKYIDMVHTDMNLMEVKRDKEK